jgi:histidine ammonia-lyase
MTPDRTASDANRVDPVQLGDHRLSIDDVVRVARDGDRVGTVPPEVVARMQATADWVADTVEQITESRRIDRKPAAYYGINTGFGGQAGRSALDSQYLTRVLGRNLMASHSVGVGPYFEEAVVRAALLIRAQSLAQGHSGVRPLVVETLLRMLNEGIYPAVPAQRPPRPGARHD